MQGKITLITPPDFFENSNRSILFVQVEDADQFKISEWFAKSNLKSNINIYFYNNETNIEWLLYASSRCDYCFIDLDNKNKILDILGGHLLAKKHFFYKSEDVDTIQICQYINSHRIINIEDFLEKALNDQARE